jgi:hypothetical protein
MNWTQKSVKTSAENLLKTTKSTSKTYKSFLERTIDIIQNLEDQEKSHLEIFGPWLESKGWGRFYNEQNWVKDGKTHHENGVPADVAVMLELGLKTQVSASRLFGQTFK